MEDYYNTKRLALILAVQSEIEGMKIENAQRDLAGESPAYGKCYFDEKTEELRTLAHSAPETL